MLRFITVVAFALAFDAPMLMQWGQAEDPVGDCQFTEKDEKLTIRVPGKYHDLDPQKDYQANGPRALRDVEGDFKIEVRVSAPKAAEKGKELEGKTLTFRAGSLLVWSDDKNFIRFDRAAMVKEGKEYATIYFHVFVNGKRPYSNSAAVVNEDSVLSIERKGEQFSAKAVQGKETKTIGTQRVPTLPAKLKVGVGAINVSSEPFEATFDAFKLTQKK